jgi:hypothetical protein
MKRILLTMTALLMSIASAMADDVTVGNIAIPQGSSATLSISLTNTNSYRQLFQLKLILPEGVTIREGSGKLSNRFGTTASLGCNEVSTRTYQFICQAGTDITPITGNSGELFTVVLDAAPSLTAGTELQGSITEIEVTTAEATAWNPEDKTFNISIAPPLESIVLNETATVAPTASNGIVDVTVNRTIKAGEWSTICLPFDMDEDQVKEAFGDDVELADFTSWSFEGTTANVEKITIGFTDVTEIEKNHPYIIKVSSNITSFGAKNVTIAPPTGDDIPYVDRTCKKGKTNYTGSMYGYYAYGDIDENEIFINGNKFWYNNGNKIKAFRATFSFGNIILNDVSSSRITMSFNGDETTAVNEIVRESVADDRYYNLSGQQVKTPTKGVYVENGKKVIVK